ncbi:MAG: ABC transporter ATP-binding protein, partial [Bacteroidota bacterium]
MQTRSWLSTEAIRLQFGKQCLVDGLELDLKPGLNMLLGRNGTGKTTLIRCLSGWITPQSGAVYIEQEAIQEIDSKELARKLAVVRTRKDRPAYFPVLDFLKLGRFPYSGFWNQTSENDQRIIDRAIDQIGIQGLLSKNLDQLSDGEYQKVAIAQSLIQETPILLL